MLGKVLLVSRRYLTSFLNYRETPAGGGIICPSPSGAHINPRPCTPVFIAWNEESYPILSWILPSYPILSWILPSYHTFGVNSHCSGKIVTFSKFELRWPLATSILNWPENDLRTSLRSRCGLCNAVCRLSLSSVVLLRHDWGGGLKPPSRHNLNISAHANNSVKVQFWETKISDKTLEKVLFLKPRCVKWHLSNMHFNPMIAYSWLQLCRFSNIFASLSCVFANKKFKITIWKNTFCYWSPTV